MKKLALVIVLAGFVSGCAVSSPVTVIGQDGRVLKGTNSSHFADGKFVVSDGKLTCTGEYPALNSSKTISAPVTCNDGRHGIVRAFKDTPTTGSGTVRLEDGYEADFLFGKAAEEI
ncbi:hypothetical protein E1162_08370 [Rhodobacteraceae bacterium RKSG542]|uniref:hypothetical protein n=1 Tax=Pseudovibrio flavus TaxID=2529854 RepID=UPI0012BBB8EA|nr:hypothetical protein [Pseudovibrio flavus]MTI17256.1 hypothetical protein [Pseudovibrio flavus]